VSLRTRLTSQYALAVIGTMLLIVAVVYLALQSLTARDIERSALRRADAAWRILRTSMLSGGITLLAEKETGEQRIDVPPNARDLLNTLSGPYLILDRSGTGLVYASPNVKPFWDRQDSALTIPLSALRRGARAVTTSLDSLRYMLVRREVRDSAFGDLVVIAGADVRPLVVLPLEVIGTLLIVFPLILGLSVTAGWYISGRATVALAGVDRITTEVADITDGRSLHRRLPPDSSSEELVRLTMQLNSMIERLESSFSALRRFTSDASHELKTPLAVLRADVERAMHAQPHSNEQLVALEEALQETTRMADLVESLLTLARADEGRFDIHREPVLMEQLTREVLETALILGEHAGIKVTMPVVDEAVVLGDRKRLRQLFLNLVTNALKYTPRGGDVELSLSRGEQEVSFSVRDTGIGISAADLPHVFERFWRADRARSRVGERGGFGLGLAIGQWIAQAHGGSLTVQSRLHRGSTFTVTLPLASTEPKPETTPDEQSGLLAAS
jgi:two-component system, OmpR family, sensor kinase